MKRFFYKRVDSTNLEARRILQQGNVDFPFLVISDSQFAGRGHGSNSWESEPGHNFTATLVWNFKNLPAVQQFSVSQSVSLAIIDFLSLFTNDPKIKWPNDLYIKESKIGGLLIENDIIGQSIKLSIIGIGLNINQEKFFSAAPNPVSLSQVLGFSLDLREVEDLIMNCLNARLTELHTVSRQVLNEEYLSHLFRYKEFAPYREGDQWIEARIVGVGEFGTLLLEEKAGCLREFGFKEIEFITGQTECQ